MPSNTSQTGKNSDVELKSAATVEGDTLHQTLGPENGFEIKSDHNGQSYVKGYIATKDGYQIRGKRFDEEVMTEEALKSIAQQINDANKEVKTADVVFPDPEALEKTTGNLEHQNAPKTEEMLPMLADTRAVPAIELASAEYDGYGVEVKAPIREDALPQDTVDAVKQNIKDGILSAFSIEFRNAKDKLVRKGNKVLRRIMDVDVSGAGLTHQPKNPTSVVTSAEIRNVLADQDTSYEDIKAEIKAEVMQEIKAEYQYDVGDEVEWGETSGTVRDRTKDSCFNERIDGDVEVCGTQEEPAYLIEVDNEDETLVGHKQGTLSLRAQHGEEEEMKASLDELDLTPPEGAQEAAQQALDWREEYPEEVDAMTETGWNRAEQLAAGEELSPADIAGGTDGMANWWGRHEEDFELDDEFEGEPWKDNGWVAGKGWGGEVGMNWAMRMKEKIEEIRSEENKSQHMKSVAGVTFQGTKTGKMDEARIDKEETTLSNHYLFGEGEDKEDFSYNVVDADGYLRRGNVEAAYSLGARGGVSESELHDKLEKLNMEFEDPPIDPEKFEEDMENKSFINRLEELEDEKSAWTELKNNITGDTMPDNDEPETDPDGDVDGEDVEEQNQDADGQEQKSAAEELKSELQEVREEMKSLVEENEQLQEENEELKNKFEDLEGLQEVKSDIDNLKEELKNVTPDNAPQQDTDETRDQQVSEQETKSRLERQLESYGNPARVVEDQDMRSAIADRHGVTESEVEEKAQELSA